MNTPIALVHSFPSRCYRPIPAEPELPAVFNAEFVERRLEAHQAWQDLAPAVEWTRFCYACNSDSTFVADRICLMGLVGKCASCGDERVAPFTRTTMEAA